MLKFEQNKVYSDKIGQPDDATLAKVAAIILGIDPSIREKETVKRIDTETTILKNETPTTPPKYIETFDRRPEEDEEIEIIIEQAPKRKVVQEQAPEPVPEPVQKPEYDFVSREKFDFIPPPPEPEPEDEPQKFIIKKLPQGDVNAFLKKSKGEQYKDKLKLQVNKDADKGGIIIPTLAEAEEARHKAQMIEEAEKLKKRQEALERARVKRQAAKQDKSKK